MELAFVNEPMNAQAVRDDETLPPGVALDDLSPQTAESFWGTVEGTGDRKKGLQ